MVRRWEKAEVAFENSPGRVKHAVLEYTSRKVKHAKEVNSGLFIKFV